MKKKIDPEGVQGSGTLFVASILSCWRNGVILRTGFLDPLSPHLGCVCGGLSIRFLIGIVVIK